MAVIPNQEYQAAFKRYKDVIFNVDVDLNFWSDFLKNATVKYQERPDYQEEIYSAGFAVYDWDIANKNGLLKMSPYTRSLMKNELESERLTFFYWIRNLALLKSYNALELLIIQSLWISHFPHGKNPIINKKSSDILQKEIKELLILNGISNDTKNNRHLIEAIKLLSPQYSSFLGMAMNIDVKTTWGGFFEMLSVLRNIIAHQGTVINNDTINELRSKAGDIFKGYFSIHIDEFKIKHLKPKENNFSNFINLINSFALNTIKIIASEPNFNFIEMY
jgi:hypothetical protein